MPKKLRTMRTFELSDKEEKEGKEWMSSQVNEHRRDQMIAIGGRFSYVFTPTGIGTFIQVQDNQTGDNKDITDIDKL